MILDGTLIAADIADNAVITSKLDECHQQLDKPKLFVDLNSNSRYRTWRSQINGLAEPADSDDAATKIM
jgi:hypothetical protein